MNSFTSRRFREAYARLPGEAKKQARRAYRLFAADPSHPSLRFKQVEDREHIYSVRVGLGYRALGRLVESDIVWFWIGPHSEYDKLI
jgi:hypothetical protein